MPPTYLMPTTLECQRGDGPIHLTAPEDRDTGGGHSAVQCSEWWDSLLSLVGLAVEDGHHSLPGADHHTTRGEELQCRDAQTVFVLLRTKCIEETSGDVDRQNVPGGGSTVHNTVILSHLMQGDGTMSTQNDPI